MGLTGSDKDMARFHDIRDVIRELVEKHLDLSVQWRKLSDTAKDTLEESVSVYSSALSTY
jgi:hypothetical protein